MWHLAKRNLNYEKNDRNYKVHDMFVLRERLPDKRYTDRDYINEIRYIMKDCQEYGLMEGYIIFGW